ncbi:MAG TPA: HAMP domain-containing sensor histidine kinase, partial [Bdellovibrio sp.]|nr:HAMP domain-containing sensor histidine kinase [Bdellovibrio sp.]
LDWLTQQVQEQYAKLVKLRMGSSSIRVVDSQGRALASYGAPMDFEKVAKSDEGISIEAPIESARFPASVDWRVQIFSPRSDVRQFIQYWKFYYILLASFFFIASAMVTIYFGKRFKDLARDYEKAIAIQNKLEDRVQERTHALEENIHELKEMQDRMVAQEKMAGLGVMATGLAHEIKNPLNIVINSAQFLKEYYLRGVKTKEELSEAREFAEMIVKHSERINALIKSILLSARTGSEQRVVVDVNQLVNECLEINLKTYQRQHHVNVQLQTSYSSAEVRANVDVEDLRRVILNILDNALFSLHKKWNESKAEKALLQVSIEKRDEKVVIIVADNGVGISEEEKRNIFTPFFTTKDPGQGTGLGLSLSADILKKYDGEIYFESEKNEYCRFYISLPVYVESRLSQAQP